MQNVREDRWKYIGGSDIPIIMGLVNYGKSRWDLLREKAQLWEDEFDGNIYTEYGNEMEESIREYINFQYGASFVEDKKVIEPCFRYHADGYDDSRETLLEIKTTSDIDTSEDGRVPKKYKKYLVQLLYGMTLYGVEHGLLAVYERPTDFSVNFRPSNLQVVGIESSDYAEVIDDVAEAVRDFLTDLEYLEENPDCEEKDLPSRNSLAVIGNQLMELEASITLLKKLEEEYKDLKARMKIAMQERNIKTWTLNDLKFTLVEDGEDEVVEKFDEKQFKKDHADMYEMYTKLQVKKGRAGYVRMTMKKGQEDE